MKKFFFMAVVGCCFSLKGIAQKTHHVTVKISQTGGCVVSIDNNPENSIRVYPNPVSSTLKIDLPVAPASISIVSVTGALILREYSLKNSLDVDVRHLSKGIYILLVQHDKTTIPVKFFKD